ncbi:MAG: cache domain-containing protein [Salinivirgaceae bacterium]
MKIKASLHKKMVLYLVPAVIAIFGLALGYIISHSQQQSLADARQIADETASKYAGIIKQTINKDFDQARGVTYAFESMFSVSDSLKPVFFDSFLKNTFDDNPQYISFWLNAELSHIDSNYIGKSGRARFTFFRDAYGNGKYKRDTLDLDASKINPEGAYQVMKKAKLEAIIEPYFFSYTDSEDDQILETSVCVPLMKGNEFAGLVGSDIELGYFQDMVKDVKLYGDGYAFLISNGGTLVAFPDEDKIGKLFVDEFADFDRKHSILKNISTGNSFSFVDADLISGRESYHTFIPVKLGETDTPWSFAISLPYKAVKAQASRIVNLSVVIGVIGLILLSILIVLIARNITNPLKQTTRVLKKLSLGEIDTTKTLAIKSGDEIEEMAQSVNQLIEGLNRTAEFARTIGKGDLNADFDKAGENDMLGSSLLEMRQSLKLAEEEEQHRKIEDEKQNWATQGQAKFGDILRQHNQQIGELAFNIMSNLVDYIGAIQGGLFIRNDDNQDEIIYELMGSVAYSRKKVMERSFKPGESLVGRCAYEKLTIYLEEVPDSYVHVTSGLGESNPRSILLVPAILNDEVFGIIELVSFNKFEPHQIAFVEKIGESIASTISNARVNDRTNKLLEQSKQQAEELAAQEEEMRQNLEELQATQEEVARLREEEKIKNQKLMDEVEKNRIALLKILDYVPNKVFLKDNMGKMLIVNKAVLKAHNAKPEDLIGKSDFDFIADKEKAQKLFEQEQQIISSGVPLHEVYSETINKSGMVLESTKYPFFIDYLDITGILGVQTDITDKVEKDKTIEDLQAKLNQAKKK